MRSDWLLDFKRNVYSGTGEDGIIERILQVLPSRDRWCVEFGAWDGFYESNTRCLIAGDGCSAVLIEADRAKYADLRRNCRDDPRVIPVHATVGWSGADALDALLAATPVPVDFDLLSIDIDGNDYHVWEAVTRYRPKVVCVEHNPTIPTGVRFVQRRDHAVSQGASLSSLNDLARSKRYELVAVTMVNAFFVDADHFSLFQIDDNRPETLRETEERITYLFTGYDGSVHLAGYRRLPWHGMELSESRVQHLPRPLRKYPKRYNRVEALLFAGLKRLRARDRNS
jgi:hypothetical protein